MSDDKTTSAPPAADAPASPTPVDKETSPAATDAAAPVTTEPEAAAASEPQPAASEQDSASAPAEETSAKESDKAAEGSWRPHLLQPIIALCAPHLGASLHWLDWPY